MTKHFPLLLAACLALFPAAAFAGETVPYFDGNIELEGYWAPQTCEGRDTTLAPTVLIIHQWKGLTDYERGRADQVAALCYNAFAVDMYGKGIRPTTNEEAGKEATLYKSNSTLARQRINAALDFISKRMDADPAKIAVMGYCFGGTMALELARSGADIDGAISFHGALSTPAPATKPGDIKASIQVHHGGDDPMVPPEEVAAFSTEMKNAKTDWVFTSYSGAVHAFTQKDAGNDPSTGVAYNEKADQRSWESATAFLREVFDR